MKIYNFRMKIGWAVVNTVTNLRVPQTEGYFLAIVEEMLYYQEWLYSTKLNHLRSHTSRFWRPDGLHFTRYRGYFLRAKQPDRDVHHFPPSIIQIESDCIYASTALRSFTICKGEVTYIFITRGDQKVFVHLLITIQKVACNVQSVS
jgi:hypothetical protein